MRNSFSENDGDSDKPSDIFLYLDTGVISRLGTTKMNPFQNLFLKDNVHLVVSHHSLDELGHGNDTSGADLLRRLDAHLIDLSEPPTIDGKVKLYGIPDHISSDELATQHALSFLSHFFRSILGGTNSKAIEEVFKEHVLSLANLLKEQISSIEDDEMRLSQTWRLRRLKEDFAAIPFSDANVVSVSDEEMRSIRAGSDYLSQITPPKIVDQILGIVKFAEDHDHEPIFGPINDPTETRDRIFSAASMLVTLGFARDKRIRKQSEREGLKGSLSQIRDIGHIAAAAGCTCFVTRDRFAARLAFALYEHFQVNTEVLYLTEVSGNPRFEFVGQEYWP